MVDLVGMQNLGLHLLEGSKTLTSLYLTFSRLKVELTRWRAKSRCGNECRSEVNQVTWYSFIGGISSIFPETGDETLDQSCLGKAGSIHLFHPLVRLFA